MDEVERLMVAFVARGKRNQSTWKLDVLMDLAGLQDPRVASFLRVVLTDSGEPIAVRIEALRRLQEAARAPDDRTAVAEAGLRVLDDPSAGDVQLFAALVLGDFTDVGGVLAALGALALDPAEPLDLRYNAFTSLQRAGPTTACLTLLQALCGDETLGLSAQSVLVAWGSGSPDR